MNFFIQTMFQLWGITICLSLSCAMLVLMKYQQLSDQTLLPFKQFQLLKPYVVRSVLPMFNLIYAGVWLIMVIFEKEASEFEIRKL